MAAPAGHVHLYHRSMASLADLTRAASIFDLRLSSVTAAHWAAPSTCEGWAVKDLADHVTGGNRFAVSLLAGSDAETAFTNALAPGFEGEPLSQYRESASAQSEAFARSGALSATVDHPSGKIDGGTFLGLRVGDLVLHGWDLARSTGGDDSLDDELVVAVWEAYAPRLARLGPSGMFGAGASGAVRDDASLAVRLLDATGRRP